MTLPFNFSANETTNRPETALRANQQAQSQGLARDCWAQMGAMSHQATQGDTALAHSLGLPDLSLFNSQGDSCATNGQPRGDNQSATSPASDSQDKGSTDSFGKQLKTAENELRQDVTHLKGEKDPSKQEIEQLHKISGELQEAEKNQDASPLSKIASELQQLDGSDGGGGGGGGGTCGSGGRHGHGGKGSGGTGGDGGGNGSGGTGGTGGDGGGNGSGGTGGTGGDGSGPGGTGSTETTFGTNAQPEVNQTASGFYVSANGSANGNGTKDDPFATLQQAQQAMQNSDIKTTYVEGGTYNMSSSLNLTSADSGESFISVGGASNPAVLNGGGKLSDLISLNGADNVNVEGFSMENTSNSPVWDTTKHAEVQPNVGAIYAENSTGDTFAYNSMNNVNVGVNMQGDSNMNVEQNSVTNAQSAIDSGANQNNVYGSNNTIQGNLVDNITGYGAKLFDNVGAINILGDTNATIDNNVIENTAGVGIEMNYRQNGSGFTVANNTLENTDDIATTAKADTSSNPVGDDGAIHIIVAPGSTKNLDGNVDNNYVDGAGANHADKGIYLDDGVNGVTVDGNFVNEGGAGDAMQIHGGSDNTVENNTFDLGSGKGILYQTDGFAMTGNKIENNDFVANGSGTQAYQFSNTDSGDNPTFSGNQYSPSIDQSPDPNGTINSSLNSSVTDANTSTTDTATNAPTTSADSPTNVSADSTTNASVGATTNASTDWSQMTRWLQSGTPGGIKMNGDVYQVPMTFDNGQQGTIVWDTSGNSIFNASGYAQYTDASGQVNQVPPGESIPIGLSPMLLS